MYIRKSATGEFEIVDEPMVLEGAAAEAFLAKMEESDRNGLSPEERAFQAECLKVFEDTQAKMRANGYLT